MSAPVVAVVQSALDRPLTVTFFKSRTAGTKNEEALSLRQLAALVEATSAPSKAELPWVKLAKFGDVRSDRGSLRHNGNLLAIDGIEGDYDGEVLIPHEAAAALDDAGLAGIVYTSPSHCAEKPRWRVLCSTSRALPPTERDRLMARLNGALGGALAGESFTLSQSYYYGRVGTNPDHLVIPVEGRCIDEADDLQTLAIYPAHNAAALPALHLPEGVAPDQRAAAALDMAKNAFANRGEVDRHHTLLSATLFIAPYVKSGHLQFDDVCEVLSDAMTEDGREPNPNEVESALRGALPGAIPFDPAINGGGEFPAEDSAAKAAVIAEFNERYMVVSESGKTLIYAPQHDPVLNRRYFDRLAFDDLQKLYMNRNVRVGTKPDGTATYQRAAEAWLRSPKRRQFIRGVTFDPSGAAGPDTLNLWQGFAVKPEAGDWSLMRQHVKKVICCDDPERFNYLTGWMARLVQHPAQQGEVAVVMKGGEGTGKGTLARALMHIMGQHGLAISNAKHLVGNFNSHLRDCVFLFADEAFYAGDPSHVGVLKSLITEPHLTIEAKFRDAVQTPNYLHIMMASNEKWVVPASLDARRFFMLEVAESVKNDHAYFGAIWRQMKAGGYAAMLHDLLAYDLTGFNVRHAPATAALQEQRKLSLPGPEAWWMDVLQRGYPGVARSGQTWQEEASTEMLFDSYREFEDIRHERHPLPRESFGRFLRKMGAQSRKLREGNARQTGYHIGALALAREAFTKATGLPVEWEPEPEGTDVGLSDMM
jgi:hypothetical protein